jgi:hypothetical protein
MESPVMIYPGHASCFLGKVWFKCTTTSELADEPGMGVPNLGTPAGTKLVAPGSATEAIDP